MWVSLFVLSDSCLLWQTNSFKHKRHDDSERLHCYMALTLFYRDIMLCYSNFSIYWKFLFTAKTHAYIHFINIFRFFMSVQVCLRQKHTRVYISLTFFVFLCRCKSTWTQDLTTNIRVILLPACVCNIRALITSNSLCTTIERSL